MDSRLNRRSGLGYRTLHALGFFAARALIDGQRLASLRQQRQQFRFERIGDSLGGILADAQADGYAGGGQAGGLAYGDERTGVADAEGLLGPVAR